MLHPKEPYLPLMHSIFVFMQKVADERAYEIEAQAKDKLNVCDGSCDEPHCIIVAGEGSIAQPSTPGTEYRKEHSRQHQPAKQGVKCEYVCVHVICKNQYCPVLSITSVQASSTLIPSPAAIRSSSSFSAPGLKIMRRGLREMI